MTGWKKNKDFLLMVALHCALLKQHSTLWCRYHRVLANTCKNKSDVTIHVTGRHVKIPHFPCEKDDLCVCKWSLSLCKMNFSDVKNDAVISKSSHGNPLSLWLTVTFHPRVNIFTSKVGTVTCASRQCTMEKKKLTLEMWHVLGKHTCF